jgi:hypothetical protein
MGTLHCGLNYEGIVGNTETKVGIRQLMINRHITH